MSNSVKSKFAGFLRGLIGRSDDRASARPVASAAPAPTSAPAPRQGSSPAQPLTHASTAVNPNEIELPLAPVVAGLPMDLRAKLTSVPPAGHMIRVQSETVINQLAYGAVKISFGELRQLAPGTFVNSGVELDNKLINLPLQEILPRLNSALLARRSTRKVEVSDEIVGPFSERGRGFSFTTQPLKAQIAASSPQPLPPAQEPAPMHAAPIAFAPPAAARQVAPPSMAPQMPQRSVTPAAPAGGAYGNGHPHQLPVSPLTPRTVTPATPGGLGPNGSGNGQSNGNGHGHANGNGSALPPGLRLGPLNGNSGAEIHASIPAPAPSPEPARLEPPQPTIFVTLGDLCEAWPDSLRNEILRSPLAQASVPLEGAIVLPGLKRGRVVMHWKHLRILAQPSSAPSPNDHLELELPLKVIAPLFLAAQRNQNLARPQARMAVAAEIPDLFFGFPQPLAAPTLAPAPVIPAMPATSLAPIAPIAPIAPAVPVVPSLPRPNEARPQDTNFYVWGERGEAPATDEVGLRRAEVPQTDFMSRQAHPKDVVDRAAALPGVVGAVVAMQDGLRVASQVPSELNPDTLAAFLPQIFERVNQCTRELRMGALNNINFTVGNVPWKIFRINAVYFAAFGRAGEQLPSAQLAQLASDLDRKKQY